MLAALRRVVREGPRRAARWLAPFWQRRRTVGGLSARWAATIPFETPRHRMTDEALAGIEEAMNERAVLRVAPVEREGATAASRAAESRAH